MITKTFYHCDAIDGLAASGDFIGNYVSLEDVTALLRDAYFEGVLDGRHSGLEDYSAEELWNDSETKNV